MRASDARPYKCAELRDPVGATIGHPLWNVQSEGNLFSLSSNLNRTNKVKGAFQPL